MPKPSRPHWSSPRLCPPPLLALIDEPAITDQLIVGDYTGKFLGQVLPAAAGVLGLPVAGAPGWTLPAAKRVCVVLVDGMGMRNLTDTAARAPFLKHESTGALTLSAGFPSTTTVSLGSFGTGRAPGQHGMLGYETLDPDRDQLLNGLNWDPAVDPHRWQRLPTVFEQLDAAGIGSVRVGPPRFEGSGLTEAALRGGTFRPANRLDDACWVAADALSTGTRLVYLYWSGVDHAGHRFGWRSRQWRDALADLDRALQRLAGLLPPETLLLVTADHGMVDLDHRRRHDLAATPELLVGVRHVGGETRCPQLYVEPGAAAEVAARFDEAFGDRAWVRTREQAIAENWFGPVDPRVAPRIGDVLVAAVSEFGIVDSRRADPKVLGLVGQHGSFTDFEQLVPLIVVES